MTTPTNPPAFPLSTIDGYSQYGMTLRDYFAAHCPITFTEAQMIFAVTTGRDPTGQELLKFYAEWRIEYADAMLAARGETEPADPVVAAAPELLTAAVRALAECVDLIATPAGNALEAAIAKASGEAS